MSDKRQVKSENVDSIQALSLLSNSLRKDHFECWTVFCIFQAMLLIFEAFKRTEWISTIADASYTAENCCQKYQKALETGHYYFTTKKEC